MLTSLALLAVVICAVALIGRTGTRPAVEPALPPSESAPRPLGPWSPALGLRRTFDSLPGPRTSEPMLRLLDENDVAWIERWRLLRGARRRVDTASFIVRNDVFGIAFLGQLLRLRQEGVDVRVLVDAWGTSMARSLVDEDYLDELREAGVEVRIYRPVRHRLLQAALHLEPLAAFGSEHDKLLLVDRESAIVGGRNIGHEYFALPSRDQGAFLDVDLLATGRATCRDLQDAFDVEWAKGVSPSEQLDLSSARKGALLAASRAMDAWLRGAPEELRGDAAAEAHLQVLAGRHPNLRGALLRDHGEQGERQEVRILDSVPRLGDARDEVSRGLARLLASARREVLIESPYLVLAEDAVERLAEAGRRGVAITIVTNSPRSSDNALSQALFLEQWPELLARVPGSRLFVRGDSHNLHGKTAVFDGTASVVGTYNLDPVSMAVNGEIALVVWSETFADRVARPLDAMIAAGPPTSYEYTIVRDAEGRPLRGPDGAPRIAFGSEDHADVGFWSPLGGWSTVVSFVRALAPSHPLLWASRAPSG